MQSGADLSGANLTDANLTGADLTETELANTNGAAIAIFHARNAMHWSTGKALEAIAKDRGLDTYTQEVGPVLEQVRQHGIDATAPATTHRPPSISWS